jgi:hypothetical protein
MSHTDSDPARFLDGPIFSLLWLLLSLPLGRQRLIIIANNVWLESDLDINRVRRNNHKVEEKQSCVLPRRPISQMHRGTSILTLFPFLSTLYLEFLPSPSYLQDMEHFSGALSWR